MFKQLAEAIASSQKVIILPHKSADGDCIGSAFALKLMLEHLGKVAAVATEEDNPRICGILYGTQQGGGCIDFDTAVAVDCGDISRLGNRVAMFEGCGVTLNIDHHATNTHFAQINYVDEDAGAAGQIIFELADYMKIPLTHDIANNLYVAISSDTGRFLHGSTTPKTHIIAARLLEAGINHSHINEVLFEKNTMAKIMLMRDALNSFETFSQGKIGMVSVTGRQISDASATDEDTEGLVNIPRSLEGVVVAAVLKEQPSGGEVKVSLRSAEADVSAIAKALGGGGHKRASGCIIKGDIAAAKAAVLRQIKKHI